MLEGRSILITGGAGSFGNTFMPMTLAKYNPKKVIIYSRDEMKRSDIAKKLEGALRVRFFIGDARNRERLYRAPTGVGYVMHAATRIAPTTEYNPFECVKCVIALSTDKASSPIKLHDCHQAGVGQAVFSWQLLCRWTRHSFFGGAL